MGREVQCTGIIRFCELMSGLNNYNPTNYLLEFNTI